MYKFKCMILVIVVISFLGCSKSEDKSPDSSNNPNSDSSMRKTFPDTLWVELPESTYSNSRASQKNIDIKNDLYSEMIRKYSEILWDEEKYLFSREHNINKGELIAGQCIDKNTKKENFSVEEASSGLKIMISFLEKVAYPRSHGEIKAKEYQDLIDEGWSYSGYINPTIYKKINDDLYENLVFTSYDYNNDSNAQFCDENGNKKDNVTTGDYVAWTKNNANNRFAGMSAGLATIKGVYYEQALNFGSYFFHSRSKEENIIGEEKNWSRPFQKSGSFEVCGTNCLKFKGSGFIDNDTMYEMLGIIDDSLGSYMISKVINYGGSSYFQEEYRNTSNNILFSKDGLCTDFILDNASNCITNSSTDNLTNSSGNEPSDTDWNNLLIKSGKFFDLSHQLDISNLSGNNKIWLIFNTNQVSNDGRMPWYKVDGIVSSDNNSNFVSSIIRYPQTSGSRNYYAYDVNELSNGPVVNSENSYLPPNSNTQYSTVLLKSE